MNTMERNLVWCCWASTLTYLSERPKWTRNTLKISAKTGNECGNLIITKLQKMQISMFIRMFD